jgi:lycopene beta-cyclase
MDQHYKGLKFKIVHTEMGAIPMTTKQVASSMKAIVPIGTIGDAVKASTGYAFQFIQAQSSMLVKQLKEQQVVDAAVHNTRHRFYDAVLLYILENKKMAGDEIFARIFKKNKAATIFRFLSNSSTLMEDIQIMRSLPTSIFLPAAIKVMFRR